MNARTPRPEATRARRSGRLSAPRRAGGDAAELAARAELTAGFTDLGSWTWEPAADRLVASDRFRELLGLPADAALTIERAYAAMPAEDAALVRGRLDAIVEEGLDSAAIEYRLIGVDGVVRWMEAHCIAVRDRHGRVEKVLGLSRDVTERVETAAEATRVQQELISARDYLRAVTDTMDESMFTLDPDGRLVYLNPAAERLLGWSYAELLGKKMHDVIHRERADGSPHPIEECPIARARTEGRVIEVAEDVFARKDGTHLPVSYTVLPFVAESGFDGCVVIFEDITERKSEERRVARDREKLAWASRIHDALAEERFELYAQPIVDCRSGRAVKRELLLRLNDPVEGLVMPGAFLPVAEELGLIREIDRWVIRHSAAIAREHGAVEVNLSARSIEDPHMVENIAAAIVHEGIDPALLVFELTETALIEDEGAARHFLERLHRLGCQVALDDFGTGYGGFTYLKQLPIDILKIDREFVRDLGVDPRNRSVVEAVVGLARSFGQTTVAEGVESQESYEQLVALGVDHAQGYHLGMPESLQPAMPEGLAARTAPPDDADELERARAALVRTRQAEGAR